MYTGSVRMFSVSSTNRTILYDTQSYNKIVMSLAYFKIFLYVSTIFYVTYVEIIGVRLFVNRQGKTRYRVVNTMTSTIHEF